MADELTEVRDGTERKRRVTQADFDTMAEYVIEEHRRRKKNRSDLESDWKEIDRQIRMEPDTRYKKLPNGRIDPAMAWMAELELPLQAQTLEVLTADARRMMFPDKGQWFRAHANTDDAWLTRVNPPAFGGEATQNLISGEENNVPTQMTQDAGDRLVEGFLNHLFRQYDFHGHYDVINAEAFKYGMGVGRARLVSKNVYMHTARGVARQKRKIPVLFPRSIKHTFLDDSPHNAMNEGVVVGPSVIFERSQKLTDLVMAANKGADDMYEGGWMPKNIRALEPKDDDCVDLLEFEGDMIVPRKSTRSLFLPNVIVTVAVGGQKGGKTSRAVVRIRYRKQPYSSYVLHPYHQENVETPYATSPLMKGRTVAAAATHALNRLMDTAMLQVAPPIGWNPDDPTLQASGGPRVHPFAQWATADPINVHQIGELGGMLQVYIGLLQQYSDLTGVNAPRLGAQTVSHTTAFAKEAEMNRGVVRTVDYVRSIGHGPLTKWLYMAYDMGREAMTQEEPVYIDAYQGFVNIDKDTLPEQVTFEWFGSGGPSEDAARDRKLAESAMLAMQMDAQNVQLGNPPRLDLNALIEETLRRGGWIDTDRFTRSEEPSGGLAPASGIPGVLSSNPLAPAA